MIINAFSKFQTINFNVGGEGTPNNQRIIKKSYVLIKRKVIE